MHDLAIPAWIPVKSRTVVTTDSKMELRFFCINSSAFVSCLALVREADGRQHVLQLFTENENRELNLYDIPGSFPSDFNKFRF